VTLFALVLAGALIAESESATDEEPPEPASPRVPRRRAEAGVAA
jgi:hypothetical protein